MSPEVIIDFFLKYVLLHTFLHELFDTSDVSKRCIFKQANEVSGLLLYVMSGIKVYKLVGIEHSLLHTSILGENESQHLFDAEFSILNSILIEQSENFDGLNSVRDSFTR